MYRTYTLDTEHWMCCCKENCPAHGHSSIRVIPILFPSVPVMKTFANCNSLVLASPLK